MRIRFLVPLELLEHLAQRNVRAPVMVERETRLEIRLRLPPQLLTLAQPSERIQKRRLLVVRDEPAFGRFELPRRIRRAAKGIEGLRYPAEDSIYEEPLLRAQGLLPAKDRE